MIESEAVKPLICQEWHSSLHDRFWQAQYGASRGASTQSPEHCNSLKRHHGVRAIPFLRRQARSWHIGRFLLNSWVLPTAENSGMIRHVWDVYA